MRFARSAVESSFEFLDNFVGEFFIDYWHCHFRLRRKDFKTASCRESPRESLDCSWLVSVSKVIAIMSFKFQIASF